MDSIVTRLGAGSLAAAALVGCLSAGAATAVTARAAAIAAPAPSATPASALSVRFTQVTRTVTRAGATFVGPRVTVSGGRPGAAKAVATAMQLHVSALASKFTGVAAGAEQSGTSARRLVDEVTGSTDRSSHYLSVVLEESVDLGGAHPAYLTHAYIFSATTGREVSAAGLFRHPHRVDRLVRSALVAGNRRVGVTASDVAGLSIVPGADGSTAPLWCYPIRTGLHCTVDPGGALGFAAGPLEATVTWAALATGS